MKRTLAALTLVAALAAAAPLFVRAADDKAADKSDEKPAAAAAAASDADKSAPAADTADALYKQIEEAKPGPFLADKRTDQEYVQKYFAEVQAKAKRRAELTKQFVEKYPDDKRAVEVRYMRATSLSQADAPDAEFRDAVNDFVKAAPKDERGAQLLFMAADSEQDATKRAAMLKQVSENYPNSDTARMAKGQLRQKDDLGKPFALEFNDAISGKKISMKDLKGKVVVIDFWATWCGPCVGEMPHNKELYAKWKDKGVEFIGVSLDQPESDGGLKKLKEFVKDNQITWPQYYQGKGWESEFSSSWGINGIPSLFVIDAEGNLHSTSARGQLETLIPELLEKSQKKAS